MSQMDNYDFNENMQCAEIISDEVSEVYVSSFFESTKKYLY